MKAHLEPRHPARLAVFHARDIDQARATDAAILATPETRAARLADLLAALDQ